MKLLAALMMAVFAAPLMASSAETLNDAKIVNILWNANKGEIIAGNLALKKASAGDVKRFASSMIKEHGMNNDMLEKLAKEEKIPMQKASRVAELKADVEADWNALKTKKRMEFDHAYIDSQVMMHEKVLAVLNSELIPAAQNAKLKEHLEKTKKHVEHHLEQAKIIQASYKAKH